VVRPHVSTRPRGSSARRLWLRLRPRLKLSWPAAPWLRAFPRARFSRQGRASLRIAFVRSTQLSRALGANAFRGRTVHRPTLIRRARRRSATAARPHVSPSPRPQRRRRAPHATTRASAARCSQCAASPRTAPRLPPRPPPRSLGRGSRRRAPTSRGFRYQLASLSAESAANCFASATSGMTGAPLPLVAVRLVARGKRAGAARFPLAAPRALAFGSRAAAPRTCVGPPPAPPCRRRSAPRPGASALPPLRPCAAGLRPARRAPALGPQSGRTSAPRPPAPAARLPTGSRRPPNLLAIPRFIRRHIEQPDPPAPMNVVLLAVPVVPGDQFASSSTAGSAFRIRVFDIECLNTPFGCPIAKN
jgi:hypothetical protein